MTAETKRKLSQAGKRGMEKRWGNLNQMVTEARLGSPKPTRKRVDEKSTQIKGYPSLTFDDSNPNGMRGLFASTYHNLFGVFSNVEGFPLSPPLKNPPPIPLPKLGFFLSLFKKNQPSKIEANRGGQAVFFDLDPELEEWDFLLKGGKVRLLKTSELNFLKKHFPNVDVESELLKAKAWLMVTQPSKRKTSRGFIRFLTGWMLRATQNPTVKPGGVRMGPNRDFRYSDEFLLKNQKWILAEAKPGDRAELEARLDALKGGR